MMVTTPSVSSDQTADTDSIVTTGWQLIKIVLREGIILAIGMGWAGFWLMVLRVHAKRGEVAGVAATGMVAMLGMGLALWRVFHFINADSLPRPVEELAAHLPKREHWNI